MRHPVAFVCAIACFDLALSIQALGQESQTQRSDDFKKFETLMSGAKLVGRFTISGQDPKQQNAEEYNILNVEKLPEGNLWMIRARIKYGEHDVTVPLPLPVEWAGSTPVIVLEDFDVPLLGRFNSRVLIDMGQKKYSGTWSHGEVGGHLYGDIRPGKAEPQPDQDQGVDKKSK